MTITAEDVRDAIDLWQSGDIEDGCKFDEHIAARLNARLTSRATARTDDVERVAQAMFEDADPLPGLSWDDSQVQKSWAADGDLPAEDCIASVASVYRKAARAALTAAGMHVVREDDVARAALKAAEDALRNYACHVGDSAPCLRTNEQCRAECGKPAGDALIAVLAALGDPK